MTISDPDSLLSSETGLILEEEAENSAHLNELDIRKPLVVYISRRSEEQRLQRGLEFDNLKPWLKSGISKCISWLNGSSFGGCDSCFLKK